MPSRSRARYSSVGHLVPLGGSPDVSRQAGVTETEALAVLQGDDPARAAKAEAALWAMWCRSGRAELDARLAEGIAAMERRDILGGIQIFTALIEAAPRWAEAWNKRATARYLVGDYAGAIDDCVE